MTAAARIFLATPAQEGVPESLAVTEEPKEIPRLPAETPLAVPEPQSRFVISLLGDCTLTSSHYTGHFERLVGEKLDYPFSNVAEILTADDLTVANLECTFSERRLESTSEYAFCGQSRYAESLVLGGIECVTMANNHTGDFGSAGVEDTAAVLAEKDITGIQGDRGVCFDLTHPDGSVLRVGVYALKFNGSPAQMEKGVAQLREEGADIVIACMHAGAEKIYMPTARQKALARAAIDGGADLVVGTHPHVLQPAEAYGDGLILYSIGNFCFGGNRNPSDKDSVIAQLVAEVRMDGVSWEMEYVPCSVSGTANTNDYRPTPFAEGTTGYQRVLRKLAEPWNRITAEDAAAAKAAAEMETEEKATSVSKEVLNLQESEIPKSITLQAPPT